MSFTNPVIPAKAGIYFPERNRIECCEWVPAFAGMTFLT
ncbi:MAG: hypothetical protein RLZZ366_2370 [Pseudomonadota bacterium]|jgi:hypothetical protein